MNIQYAHPWNKLRAAIPSPYLTYEQTRRRDQMIAALSHANDLLDKQPQLVQRDVKHRVIALEKTQGLARANAYLAKTFVERTLPRVENVNTQYRLGEMAPGTFSILAGNESGNAEKLVAPETLWRLVRRFNRLPDMARADVDLLAGDIASFIMSEIVQAHEHIGAESDYRYTHHIYMTAAAITRQLGQQPPLWDTVTSRLFNPEDVAPAIHRMKTEKWWKGRLRRVASTWREHLQIALANVSKKHSPYASKICVNEWREQKRRTREFLKGLELEDDKGNRISLIDKYDGSVANPAIRRCELMTRIRGFENICNEMGYVGEFYTLTAPASYHATIKTGHRNRKWNGSSPSDTQRYLCNVWQKVRAKLHREDIRVFGIRVAEPHHDGTPHWHMLMFMLPEDVDRVRLILRDYAYQQDSNELTTDKARKARFHAEAIDPEKGSATGYVAKYISKNIDGYALDGELDDESGQELKETAPAVSAWAARWHIRQFQFVGGAPVTVYRELRRMADSKAAQKLSVEFAATHDAADAGDWAAYVNAQGGPFVRRDDLTVRSWYQAGNELNEYGEETVSIKGVYAASVGVDKPVLTRLTQWKIVPKRAVDLAVDLKDASASSRSSVNNCTGQLTEPQEIDFTKPPSRAERRRIVAKLSSQDVPAPVKSPLVQPGNSESRQKLHEAVKDISGVTLTESEITRMMTGAKVILNGKSYFSGSAGNLYGGSKPDLNPLERFSQLAKRVINTKKE